MYTKHGDKGITEVRGLLSHLFSGSFFSYGTSAAAAAGKVQLQLLHSSWRATCWAGGKTKLMNGIANKRKRNTVFQKRVVKQARVVAEKNPVEANTDVLDDLFGRFGRSLPSASADLKIREVTGSATVGTGKVSSRPLPPPPIILTVDEKGDDDDFEFAMPTDVEASIAMLRGVYVLYGCMCM